MSAALITFKLPTTRVNSASFAESEIDHIDIYDNSFGDDHGEEERRQEKEQRAEDQQRTEQSKEKSKQEAKGEKSKQAKSKQDAPEQEDDGLEKQDSPHKRRRKIGVWSGEKEGERGKFTTDELSPGVHFFQLVVHDKDGRASSPSAPFRLNVSEEGDTDRPEKNDEPHVLHNVSSTGYDEDRPSAVTQVEVKLV